MICQGIWKCVGAESGTAFSEVDLEEGEWVDYDEKVIAPNIPACVLAHVISSTQSSLPVGVSTFESQWARA